MTLGLLACVAPVLPAQAETPPAPEVPPAEPEYIVVVRTIGDSLVRARQVVETDPDVLAESIRSARSNVRRFRDLVAGGQTALGTGQPRRVVTRGVRRLSTSLRRFERASGGMAPESAARRADHLLELNTEFVRRLAEALGTTPADLLAAPGGGLPPLAPQKPGLTPQAVSEFKSGISLNLLGDYGTDYLVENWYHDPRIDPRCTVYLRDGTRFGFRHNAMNIMNDGVVVGADGGGVIRYRVDQELTRRAKWSDHPRLYPAYTGTPLTFAGLEYDPGQPVNGVTGPLPGVSPSDSNAFYWRGMLDGVGDEWHVIAVGDDDKGVSHPNAPTFYAHYSSDGKVYTFVVNPKTPSVAFIKRSAGAQWYTTPPKAYFVPRISDQVTYLAGDVDIEIAALGGAEVQWSLRRVGSTDEEWVVYSAPLNTIRCALAADTKYELRHRIGADGAVRTRVLHFAPAYPSDAETHPQNLFWRGSAGLARIKSRIKDASAARTVYRDLYRQVIESSFMNRLKPPYAVPLMNGFRRNNQEMAVATNAFPILIDGVGAHPDQEKFVHDALLDNYLNLDPVGLEHNHNYNTPTSEILHHGYYSMNTPLATALAYDWVIKDLRAGRSPHGLTAVEDHKVRDNLAMFAMATMVRYTDPYPNFVDANGYDTEMWSTAWLASAQIISAVLPEYQSRVYGTSGAPGGSTPAPRKFEPYPDQAVTWWDLAADKDLTAMGSPNVARRSGFWGLLNENLEWNNRPGYWSGAMMGRVYYLVANFRANYDRYHYAHFDAAFLRVATGKLISTQAPQEGPVEHYTVLLVNHNFPTQAAVLEPLLATEGSIQEKSIQYSLWYHGVLGLCLYEDDWRSIQ